MYIAKRAAVNPSDSSALVARQPIYSAAMTVAAYELLYAPVTNRHHHHHLDSESEKTLSMLADAALEIGLDRLAGTLPVYVNYPAELLSVEKPLSVQPQRVVIQISAADAEAAAVHTGVGILKARGHLIALSNYHPQQHSTQLLELADVVKMPFNVLEPAALSKQVPLLTQRGLRVIATGIHSIAQFNQTSTMGFCGFQGDFLNKPQYVEGNRTPCNAMATLRLVSMLQDPGCSFDEVENLMNQNLPMCYRALRCINSSYYSLPQRVDSIRQALVLLGIDNLRQLCSLAALQQLDDCPASVLVTAMARARMCEQLAQLAGQSPKAPYFITGLFSMLETLLGMPLQQIIQELPLAPAVEAALISGTGDLGKALACTRAYERAAFNDAHYHSLPAHLIRAIYLDATQGADQALASIH